MSIESGTASLHAGLIERARPRREQPDDPLGPMTPGADTGAVEPREVVRERPVFGLRQVQPAPIPEIVPPRPAGKRYGLTVRVHEDLREVLRQFGQTTGRTNQSILHEALAARLAGVESHNQTH